MTFRDRSRLWLPAVWTFDDLPVASLRFHRGPSKAFATVNRPPRRRPLATDGKPSCHLILRRRRARRISHPVIPTPFRVCKAP